MTTKSPQHCKAVIDANVLAPVIRRTVIRALAGEKLFLPVISDRILTETAHAMGHIARNVTDRDKSDLSILRAEWTNGWVQPDGAEISLPDPDDIHVVEAALTAGADVIVTENIRDFPKKALAPMGLRAETADQFVFGLLQHEPERTLSAISTLPARLPDIFEEQDLRTVLRRAGFRRLTKAMPADI